MFTGIMLTVIKTIILPEPSRWGAGADQAPLQHTHPWGTLAQVFSVPLTRLPTPPFPNRNATHRRLALRPPSSLPARPAAVTDAHV